MNKQEALFVLRQLPYDCEVQITINSPDKYISSGDVESLGVSRQLLGYHVKLGDVRTVAVGRQKKYLLADILKLKD